MIKRHAAAGFTLIEMMVVLGILGLMLALVPSALSIAIPGQQLRAATNQLADDLRDARARAVLGGEPTAVAIKLEGAGQRVGTTGARLPRDTTILVQNAPAASIVDDVASVSFFPDGSASGGTIGLSAGGRTYTITVDWLTGRVAVDD